MHFDDSSLGRVDSNGVRNFRQALASPHPGLFHRIGAVSFDSRIRGF
jgi:hypothetical protein